MGALHDHPACFVVAIAGGGNALITDLLDVPGASRTVLEIVVPYAPSAMAAFVSTHSDGSAGVVSAAHGELMAGAAHRRARALAPDRDPADVFGLAVTAALATDRERRGDHRAHIVLAGRAGTVHRRVDLVKGDLDRSAEDRAVADAALAFVAEQLT